MKIKINNFICLIDSNTNLPFDDISFKLDKDGYVIFRFKKDVKRKVHKLHRVVMEVTDSNVQVDHINGNKLDNRKQNLRLCNRFENQQNRKKSTSPTHSKFKGVTWHKGKKKWMASITAKKKTTFLGYFEDEQFAAITYNTAAIALHGNFAKLNVL